MSSYWEQRALRFGGRGEGLAAVCSYGMPEFYNRWIDWCQRLALAGVLRVRADTRVLDVGCGVGRWSRRLARYGARVTGVDVSVAMIEQARRRAAAQGFAARCRFIRQDVTALQVGGWFDLILGVTVLQHILEPAALYAAVQRLASHLTADGTLILLEAAPARAVTSCNSAVFQARQRDEYLAVFEACGLEVKDIRGVDPAPFKTWLLPHLQRLPRLLRTPLLAAVTLLSIPIDVPFGRMAVGQSWHVVFILKRARGRP